MLEHLFGSKTRVRLLKVFFKEPARAFYVRELTRLLDTQINAVRRELELLIESTLVKETDAPGNMNASAHGARLRKYYILNVDSILYHEMQALLVKAQALGREKFVQTLQQKKYGVLQVLVLAGQFMGDPNAETDLLIVGKMKPRSIDTLFKKYEKEFGFDIRYTLMDSAEYFDRRNMMDKFLYSIFDGKHIKVVDHLVS